MTQSLPIDRSKRFRQPLARMVHQPFELLLFATDPEFIRRAVAAGIDGIIVDCEYIGKAARQAGADTEINYHTFADVERVRSCTSARVLCRINRYGSTTWGEVEQAIAVGADEILLPMVQTPAEMEAIEQGRIRSICMTRNRSLPLSAHQLMRFVSDHMHPVADLEFCTLYQTRTQRLDGRSSRERDW